MTNKASATRVSENPPHQSSSGDRGMEMVEAAARPLARRVRVVFENPRGFLGRQYRSMGLDHCWIHLHPGLATISDLAAYLMERFSLRRCRPCDLLLSVDGFVLPPFESSRVLTESDIIRVKKLGGLQKEVTMVANGEDSIPHSHSLKEKHVNAGERLLAIRDSHDKSESESEDGIFNPAKMVSSTENPSSGSAHLTRKRRNSDIDNLKMKGIQSSCNDQNISTEDHGNMILQLNNNSSQEKSIANRREKNSAEGSKKKTLFKRNDQVYVPNPSSAEGGKKKKLLKRNDQADGRDLSLAEGTANDVNSTHDIVRLDKVAGECRENTNKPQVCYVAGQESGSLLRNGANEDDFGKECTESGVDNIPVRETTGNFVAAENGEMRRIDLEKLFPLSRLPKEGDVVAYRLVDMSTPFCPQLSSFRVGKVTSYEPMSLRIVLLPTSDFQICVGAEAIDAGPSAAMSVFPYKEDGSLETQYPSLVDVRLVEGDGIEATANSVGNAANANKWESKPAEGSLKPASEAPAGMVPCQNGGGSGGGGWDEWPKADSATMNSWLNYYMTVKENLFPPSRTLCKRGSWPRGGAQRGAAQRGRGGTRGASPAPWRGGRTGGRF